MKIALLTGGKDRPYAYGLLRELLARGVDVACVGNDELAACPVAGTGRLEFHNLVRYQGPDHAVAKIWRVLSYYCRLIVFAARTDAKLFHILWFRKFPWFERIVFVAYLRVLRKKIVFTAHNVDDRARDGTNGGFVDRLSLTYFYRTVDHVLVHTPRMRQELAETFDVSPDRITPVPFGINDVIPTFALSRSAAKIRLAFAPTDRVILFFGTIAPYKGVEDLIRAVAALVDENRFRLVIAGPLKDRTCEPYWRRLQALIEDLGLAEHVRTEIRHIPDSDVGLFFSGCDVCVLPYRRIYQSGVLALSYAQGLPVIAADVGSLAEDVLEGETGFVFRARDVIDLTAKLKMYFSSDLFLDLDGRRHEIQEFGMERFSWSRNAERTCA